MKKLLLLSTLIAIMPFGVLADYTYDETFKESLQPVSENGGVVYITGDGGPYPIADITNDDKVNIPSAAYVKGAYNDTIAAINHLELTAQEKIVNQNYDEMYGIAFTADNFIDEFAANNLSNAERLFVSAAATAAGIKSQRVTAVDSWGSNHTVDLGLKTVTQ